MIQDHNSNGKAKQSSIIDFIENLTSNTVSERSRIDNVIVFDLNKRIAANSNSEQKAVQSAINYARSLKW